MGRRDGEEGWGRGMEEGWGGETAHPNAITTDQTMTIYTRVHLLLSHKQAQSPSTVHKYSPLVLCISPVPWYCA